MPDTNLFISVVICSYNRAGYIINALDSLYHQTLDKRAFEVIVVDNNSIDNTRQLVEAYIEQHPDFHCVYLTESRQGASFARNTGAAFSRGQLLCFMDDDAVAARKFLERIQVFFNTHADAAGLGGRIIPKYIPAEPAWMSYYVSSLVGNFHYSDQVDVFKPGKFPLESNMTVLKSCFDAIGGFDTNLPGVVGTVRIGGEGKDFFFAPAGTRKKNLLRSGYCRSSCGGSGEINAALYVPCGIGDRPGGTGSY